MRWTPRRKAELVVAIGNGEISASEAKSQYYLSDEELQSWVRDYDAYGWPGLRSTRYQLYAQTRRLSTSGALLPLSWHNGS
jgi:hypothetical protein